MSLIKEAQELQESIQMVVEACEKHNISVELLESLDGILHTYVQRINSGQLTTLQSDDAATLANIFAMSSLIGATRSDNLDTTTANGILNLYKTVVPGDLPQALRDIHTTVDGLTPEYQQKFRTLANAWGKNLTNLLSQSNPDALKKVSRDILRSVELMRGAIGRIESQHRGNIDRSAIQAASWTNRGILGRKNNR